MRTVYTITELLIYVLLLPSSMSLSLSSLQFLSIEHQEEGYNALIGMVLAGSTTYHHHYLHHHYHYCHHYNLYRTSRGRLQCIDWDVTGGQHGGKGGNLGEGPPC
jgi:hypothetical protein